MRNIHFRVKRVFTSMLISYIVMLILPCILIIQMYAKTLDFSRQSCVDESLVTLRQAMANMDERLELMDQVSRRIVIDFGAKAVMNYGKPKPGYPFVYQILKFSDRLYDKLSIASDALTGYRLFFKDNELVFYNQAVSAGLEFYFNNSLTYQDISYDEWYEKIFTPTKRTLYPSTKISVSGSDINAISYVYPILNTSKMQSGGAIHFLIPDSFIGDVMSAIVVGEESSGFFLEGDGSVLYHMGSKNASLDMDLMREPEGSYYVKTGAQQNIIIYTRSLKSDLVFAVSLPEHIVMGKMTEVKRTAQISIAVLMFTEVLMCIFLAWYNATPIMNFIRNLRRLLTDSQNSSGAKVNDYTYLQESLPRLKTMKSALEEKQSLEQNRLMDMLFEGGLKNSSALSGKLQELGLAANAQAYCAVSFEAAGKAEQCAKLLKLNQRGGYAPSLVHVFEEDIAACIYCFTSSPQDEAYQSFIDCISDEISYLAQQLGANFRAGVGRIYEDISDLCFSYNQSKYCLAGSSEQAVVEYDQMPKAINAFYYPIALEQKLINAALHWETAQIREVFSLLQKENLHRRKLIKSMSARLISNLEATLLKTCETLAYQDANAEDALIRISKGQNLAESLNLICEEFVLVASREKEKKESHNLQLKTQMKDFILLNYPNPAFGVSVMAQQFGWSESYFSQLFKDVMGDRFSNYLENIRMEKAKQLILEDKLEIEAIAQLVGYTNSTTFRRAFKRLEGISPTTYRAAKDNDAHNK